MPSNKIKVNAIVRSQAQTVFHKTDQNLNWSVYSYLGGFNDTIYGYQHDTFQLVSMFSSYFYIDLISLLGPLNWYIIGNGISFEFFNNLLHIHCHS